jgi:hypothetical protein
MRQASITTQSPGIHQTVLLLLMYPHTQGEAVFKQSQPILPRPALCLCYTPTPRGHDGVVYAIMHITRLLQKTGAGGTDSASPHCPTLPARQVRKIHVLPLKVTSTIQ